MKTRLQQLPGPEALLKKFPRISRVPEVNGHLHSPYSFCSFDNIPQMFAMAREEGVAALGINDFFTVDGYPEFNRVAEEQRIFPLFNIEFMGLMTDLQAEGVRVNDPNNPGRTYFSGKALRYPFSASETNRVFLENLQASSQLQMKEMCLKLGAHLDGVNAPFRLSYEEMLDEYAESLLRERHIARALREAVTLHYHTEAEQVEFYQELYGGKSPEAPLDDPAAMENEIRGRLLKKGGTAYVEEDSDAFPGLAQIIDFILDAGGIPCYPVLLDDKNGNLTEFEGDWDRMHEVLGSLGVSCLELIPQRNSLAKLEDFVLYMMERRYTISFGTEHNSPGLFPVTVKVQKDLPLNEDLKKLSYRGVCVLAAHQYLIARGEEGFLNRSGYADHERVNYYQDLGNAVISSFNELSS